MYLVSLFCGLVGWEFSSSWWRRVWPIEQREEYGNAIGYQAARAVRLLAFLLLFLPVVGFAAFLAAVAAQLWHMLTAPLRWLRWLRGKTGHLERAGAEPRS